MTQKTIMCLGTGTNPLSCINYYRPIYKFWQIYLEMNFIAKIGADMLYVDKLNDKII